MLEVQELTAGYDSKAVLQGISLTVNHGEVVALLGPNGAGKTTTLMAILHLVAPRTGAILLDGRPITHLPTESIVARGIVLVPEGRHIFPGLTVHENLIAGSVARRLDRRQLRQQVAAVLDLFPALRSRLSQYGWSLSGGEQQMLAVGRALCAAPDFLLIDEPSLGLAPTVVDEVFRAIGALARKRSAILLAEQNAALAMEIADRAYVLQAGQVIAQGSADTLRETRLLETAYLAASGGRLLQG